MNRLDKSYKGAIDLCNQVAEETKPKNWIPLKYFMDRYGSDIGVKRFIDYMKDLDNEKRI